MQGAVCERPVKERYAMASLVSYRDNVEDPRPSGQDRPNHQGIWKDGPDDFDIPKGHSTE
jgi:hypothetical protein